LTWVQISFSLAAEREPIGKCKYLCVSLMMTTGQATEMRMLDEDFASILA